MPKARKAVKKRTPAAARKSKPAHGTVDAALALFESLPVPIFAKSRDGAYLGANRAWEEFFGRSRDAIIGKSVRELLAHAPDVAKTHEKMDEKLWRSAGGQSYELPVASDDGRKRDAIYYKATFPA